MMRTASLGMYDMPAVQPANDALWTAVATRLRGAGFADVPDALDRSRPLRAVWDDPELLLGQTCGYPLMTGLSEAVAVVAAPVHDLPGCAGARHRSFLVVSDASSARSLDGLRGACAAINGRDSNTGMNLFRARLAPLAGGRPFFGAVVETCAHLASLRAVAEGAADIAAIDCVTYGLAQRHRPDLLAGTRILGETSPSPSLPFVTRKDASAAEIAAIRAALADAVADPSLREATQALGLVGIEPARLADYAIVMRYERDAVAAGYPSLA